MFFRQVLQCTRLAIYTSLLNWGGHGNYSICVTNHRGSLGDATRVKWLVLIVVIKEHPCAPLGSDGATLMGN